MKCSSLVLAAASWALIVRMSGYTAELPDDLCVRLIPQHLAASTQSSKGGFEIVSNLSHSSGVYTPGGFYEVTLRQSNPSNNPANLISEFILQAVDASAAEPIPVGVFSFDSPLSVDCFFELPLLDYVKNCSTEYPNATIVQAQGMSFPCISLAWVAPSVPGAVDFRYTIVGSDNDTAYGPFSLLDKEYMVSTPTDINQLLTLTCPEFSSDNTSTNAFQVHLGVTGGINYSFIAEENTNDRRFLDIKLGAIAQSWVAIGFSSTSKMAEADVLACIVHGSSGAIAVVDGWNPLPNHLPTVVDNSQLGVCFHTASFIDGLLSCSFSRYIDVINVDQDVSLYDTLYQMYAFGDRTVPSSPNRQDEANFGVFVAQHEDTPGISYSAITIVNATNTFILPSRELIKIHGVLMIFAWMMLAMWASFLSIWLRPALPRGEWLEFHQTFMIATTMLSAFGIVAIVSANYNNYAVSPGLISFSCGRSTSHFILGAIVVLLLVTNSLLPAVRCQPASSRRWIFTLLHGNVLGLSTILLALINIGLGIILYEVECRDLESLVRSSVLWVYVGFIVFQAVIQSSMILLFTVSALKQKDLAGQLNRAPLFIKFFIMMFKSKNRSDKQELIELRELSDSKKPSKDQPLKVASVASEDSRLRWACSFIFIPVTLIVPLVLAVLLVSAPIAI